MRNLKNHRLSLLDAQSGAAYAGIDSLQSREWTPMGFVREMHKAGG